MSDTMVKIDVVSHETINGDDYKNLIIGAAQSLENSKEEINDLNVFPVPDGDTGSNMSMTVGNAARELLRGEGMTLEETAEMTAKAMLRGARGNSGVIVSLLFRGIAKGLKNSFECDGVAWADALKQGVEAAYSAVEHPAEGTILTVARKCAEAAKAASKEHNDFEYVLGVAIEAAEKALDETVNENPVLEKAGVVDAGGMGWLVVMKAMYNTLTLGGADFNVKAVESEEKKAVFSSFKEEDITFSYCTELTLKKYSEDTKITAFKEYLSGMGDSLVVIDDGDDVKVHVHTDEPYAVLGEALKYGTYEAVKIENMRTQHTQKIVAEAKAESQVAKKTKALPSKAYGFVSVASGEGLSELFSELGVDTVVSGGQTMNPSCEDIYKAVMDINAQCIFILPNNKNIIMSCEQVKEMCDKKIVVIPTKTVPQGISAMLAFDESADPEQNQGAMVEMAGGVSTIQVTYAARSTTFDGLEITEGEYLAMDEGKLLANGKDLVGILNAVGKRLKDLGKSTVSIYYGADVTQEVAESTLEQLSATVPDAQVDLYNGGQPVYYFIISAE